MKKDSKFLKLVLVGVLGAVVMISCGDDGTAPEESSEYDENGCHDVYNDQIDDYETICDGPVLDCVDIYSDDEEVIGEECTEVTTIPDEETTTTVEETTTTVEETTTTTSSTTSTTLPRPTTTVKKTTAATTPVTVTTPGTTAPTTAAPTTQAPTTAPPTTLPPVNARAEWSGLNEGCPYQGMNPTLDVVVTGGTSPQVSVTVQGMTVTQPGPSYTYNGETTFWFDGFPTSLADGTYTVNISVSDVGYSTTTLSKSVVYLCP